MASALARHQKMLGPFKRRLTTRRTVLSMAPLPIGSFRAVSSLVTCLHGRFQTDPVDRRGAIAAEDFPNRHPQNARRRSGQGVGKGVRGQTAGDADRSADFERLWRYIRPADSRACRVGKSCLAGKLLERCADKELIVIRGEVKKIDVLQKLRHMFDRQGIACGLDMIKSETECDDKIKALFRGALQEQPTVLYFDDFEQNLVRHGDEYHVTEDVIEIVKPLLTAVDWAEGKTNLMITSRYPFVLESEGQNLPAEKLEDLSLMSFKGPDLEKKKHAFRHIPASAHSELYMAFGKGNPRLLEWLEKIAAEEAKYDLEALKEALQGTAEEYIQQYVAEIMAKTQGEDFLHFLHQAAVFCQPVEQSAFAMFGSVRTAGERRGPDPHRTRAAPRARGSVLGRTHYSRQRMDQAIDRRASRRCINWPIAGMMKR